MQSWDLIIHGGVVLLGVTTFLRLVADQIRSTERELRRYEHREEAARTARDEADEFEEPAYEAEVVGHADKAVG